MDITLGLWIQPLSALVDLLIVVQATRCYNDVVQCSCLSFPSMVAVVVAGISHFGGRENIQRTMAPGQSRQSVV